MTNFSGGGRKGIWAWLSPERAVLVLPVMAGLGLAVLVSSAGVTPLSLRVNTQKGLVDELQGKSDRLPLRERRLLALQGDIAQRQQQQERLLALVAGTSTSELNTFLAELNNLANTHQVTITTTEPGAIVLFSPPVVPVAGAAPPAAGGGTSTLTPSDALLAQGVEKRSVGLTVKGSFPQVFNFLRALERLQVFVSISEMDVSAEAAGGGSASQADGSEVTLAIKLTAYGRQSIPLRVASVDGSLP